jgi:hypothetical protein
MKTHPYPTNLTDAEWALLEPLFPRAHAGHPRHHHVRTIVNALLYVLCTAIRISLVGIVLGLSSSAVELGGDWSASPVLAITGIVLFALGMALLIIAFILVAIIGIIFGG